MKRLARGDIGRLFSIGALVLLTYLLWGTWATWPVQLFVVFVHETGHAIATLLTGGEVEGMTINRWLGGQTYARGGIPLITLQAGYAASVGFGAAMVVAAARPKTARGSLAGLAVLTIVCGLAFARPVVGLALPFAMGTGLALAWIARDASEQTVRWVLIYLATVSALYSLVDIREDVLHLSGGGRVTDATLLEARTGIPAILWGLGWAVGAILLLGFALRRALRR